MTRPLLVVGDGPLARELVDLVDAVNAAVPTWEVVAGVADDPALTVVVAGGGSGGPAPSRGASLARARAVRRLDVPAHRLATLVHPSAVVAPSARLGPGAVVHPLAVIGPGAVVGAHAHVRAGAVVGADCVLGDLVTVGSGVRLGEGVLLDEGVSLAAGVLVDDQVSVGAWAVATLGSVLVHPVPEGEVWSGVPAVRTGRATVPDPVSVGAAPDRSRRVALPIALGPVHRAAGGR